MKDQEVGMDENNESNGGEIARALAKRWLTEGAELVPLALIALEVDEPIELIADRLDVVVDDVGMRAVPVEVARRFLTERAEQTRRMAEQALQLQESQPLPVGGGVPALEDAGPFESLMNGDPGYQTPQAEFGREKPNFLEEQLEAGGRHLAAERARAREGE